MNMTTQREAFEKYCTDNNMTICGSYVDEYWNLWQAALSQPDEPATLLVLKNTQLQKRIDLLEDLLTSAHNIANRNGADTHWLRFAGQLHVNGISCVTAKTFKILPSDDNYLAPPNTSELEQVNKVLEAKVKELEVSLDKSSKNYIKACKGRMAFRNSFRERKAPIADLTAKLEKMREALEFYADRNMYAFNFDKDLFMTDISKDAGLVARKALEECK